MQPFLFYNSLSATWHDFFYFFFYRKRQRDILIKRKYKRRMRNPSTKEKQNYRNQIQENAK